MWVTFCGISSFYIFFQDKDSGQICCLFLEKVFLALALYISLIDTWIAPMKIFLFSFTLRFFWIALGKFSHRHVDHFYENFSFFFTFRFFWIGLGNGQLRGKLSNVWWTQPTLFFFPLIRQIVILYFRPRMIHHPRKIVKIPITTIQRRLIYSQ